ncbi:putative rhamnogalacturonate lyase C [Cladobotryum mycophilum]|uniref:Rhamnogalacturonate lyase C n=1 Tax=Cladobotryum mycophilum TaxID=491253 RepID=A0ABR0SUW6_9HYPO
MAPSVSPRRRPDPRRRSLEPGELLGVERVDVDSQSLQISKTVKWIEDADYEAKIVVAGNHDVSLDSDFYFHHGRMFHNQSPQEPELCLALLTSSPTITYLCHDSATIRLKSPDGPHTEFTVFGSPYSPRHGLWAFYYDAPKDPENTERMDLTALWELIPLETDIVVTHTPPLKHRDKTLDDQYKGCEALRQALWRVRPKLAVCGHVHSGRGAERVLWDLECREKPYLEKAVVEWEDPGKGNNKNSLVDLTGRKEAKLANNGAHPGRPRSEGDEEDDDDQLVTNTTLNMTASSDVSPHGHSGSSVGAQDQSDILGYGIDPESDGGDLEALLGRMGRKETCIVNAAIMKKNYPHIGGKEFNKPIVVDVDLPVWEEED